MRRPSRSAHIWDDIPADVMAKLRRCPTSTRGTTWTGHPVDEFDDIPALQGTYREFAKATEEMVAFVGERME